MLNKYGEDYEAGPAPLLWNSVNKAPVNTSGYNVNNSPVPRVYKGAEPKLIIK